MLVCSGAGAGGAMAPPDLGRSVTPISKQGGGADYAHQITTCPPGFSDLPTALQSILEVMASLCFWHHGTDLLLGNGGDFSVQRSI